MRVVYFICIVIIFSINSVAQSVNGKISYRFSINEVKNASNGINGVCEAVLFFNDTSYLYQEINPSLKSGVEIKKTSDNTGTIAVGSDDKYLFEHYYNIKTKQSFIKDRIFIKYFKYKADTLIPKWTLVNETKKIDKYTCQKAVTEFCGRSWIVWFTTELPYEFGPWKLHGLPGLILYAEDFEKKYSFQFTGILIPASFNCDGICLKNSSKEIIATSYNDFILFRKNKYDDIISKSKTIGGENLGNSSFKIAETRDKDF
jgi:GLPGLI family protein